MVVSNPDQPVSNQPPGADGYEDPLTTKEGWSQFVARTTSSTRPEAPVRPEPPPVLNDDKPGGDRPGTIDPARLLWHSRSAVVNTPLLQCITNSARRLTVLNRQQVSARRGLIITGSAGTGKTTAITQMGAAHEFAIRARQPGAGPMLPVVYITVPPAATAKMLAMEFARFLGLPLRSRVNLTDVTEAVCRVLIDVGCSLVIVDELHNMRTSTRAGVEVSDQLKYFAERLPATFVYAGIELVEGGLFSGTQGRQIASRFVTVPARPFGCASLDERKVWGDLIDGLESWLRLHRHRPGSLSSHAVYLHDRTGGMIGSLSHLVREAALEAIITGEEKITLAGLQMINLDHAAETHYLASQDMRRGRRSSRR